MGGTTAVRRQRVRVPGWAKVLWGLAVVVLNLALVAGVPYYARLPFFLSAMPPGTIGDRVIALFRLESIPLLDLMAVAVCFALARLVALVGSIAHVFLWSGFSRAQRIVWLVVLLFALQPGLLLYWSVNVMREPVSTPAASAGGA